MNRNKALALAGVALILIGLVSVCGQNKSDAPASAQAGTGFTGLDARINDITRFKIEGADGAAVTIARDAEVWQVVERANFPANLSKVRSFLITFSQAEVLEKKTSKTANYERLAVQDYAGADAENAQVSVWAGEENLATVIVGDTDSAGRGSYARKAGQAQSVLLNETIATETRAEQWLLKSLADVKRARLSRVEVNAAEQKPYTLVRAAGEKVNFELATDSAAKLKSPETFRVTSVLENLSFTDLVTDSVPEVAWSTTKYETRDGLRVTVKSAEKDAAHYIKMAAEFDAALVQPKAAPADEGEAGADIEAATDVALSADGSEQMDAKAVQAEAETLGRLAQNRIFKIAAYKSNNLRLKLEELRADAPKDEDKK